MCIFNDKLIFKIAIIHTEHHIKQTRSQADTLAIDNLQHGLLPTNIQQHAQILILATCYHNPNNSLKLILISLHNLFIVFLNKLFNFLFYDTFVFLF